MIQYIIMFIAVIVIDIKVLLLIALDCLLSNNKINDCCVSYILNLFYIIYNKLLNINFMLNKGL